MYRSSTQGAQSLGLRTDTDRGGAGLLPGITSQEVQEETRNSVTEVRTEVTWADRDRGGPGCWDSSLLLWAHL